MIIRDDILVFVILGGTFALFAWNRWRYDVVGLIALLAAVLTGIVPVSDAFSGFGHPAVITVAAVLVVSQALRNSGVVDEIVRRLIPFTRNPTLHILLLTGTVTIASAFMNNVGALALMLPVALATAAEQKHSPAMLLMPIAFGSLLGGLTTLIGTPPNIIVGSYRAEVTGEPFGMFDYSPVGILIAVAGVAFVTLLGWRLIPRARRAARAPADSLARIDRYITEVQIGENSPLAGEALAAFEGLDEDIDLIGLARGRGQALRYAPDHTLAAGDILVLRADPKRIEAIREQQGLELLTSATPAFYELTSGDLTLVEAVVSPTSPLIGRGIPYLRRRAGGTLALVALAREGKTVRRRLTRQTFAASDVLLLQGEADSIDNRLGALGLLPLAARRLRLGQPRRIGLALAIFAAAIAASVLGWLSITVALLAAVVAYVLVKLLPARELYDGIDWSVIVLLGAMIPVGRALETTGATGLIAQSIVGLTGSAHITVVVALILIVTMFLSDIVNNAATAVVMAPIAAGIAGKLELSADPFLMSVAVGASCAFLTPIGHQSNTLVMGPGGYRFTDYWRMGLPLELLIVLIAVPMILLVWPP